MQADIIAARAEVDCMFPPQEICAMQDMFCFAALADAITGTMYTNITGAFVVCSFKSMQYVFVAYIYNLNAIIVWAMPSHTNMSMVQAFTKVISILKSGGYHSALNIMDNECSVAVEKYIQSKAVNIQLVPPHDHQANAAERAITTFKEHFIAALATVDMLCSFQLWDEFLPQVELTLNMLHFSQQNPKKSANQEVYGSFDFNKTSLAPLGTKPWYTTIQDLELPGRHMQPMGSTLDPPSTTTNASISTFLQHAASASPTPGACTQPTAKSQFPCNMTSPLQQQQTSSKCLGILYQNRPPKKSSTYKTSKNLL
jgi:hypothetical protein